MKIKSPVIILSVGIILFLGVLYNRINREKNLLSLQLLLQQSATYDGLKNDWKEFLLEKAQEGRLSRKYRLLWNRRGNELRSIFFPEKSSVLNWELFREAVKKEDQPGMEKFLAGALARKQSWDRILAIAEWSKYFPQKINLETPYEESLSNETIRMAYWLQFEAMGRAKDRSGLTSQLILDEVFLQLQLDGSIETFVPDRAEVKLVFLSEFVKEKHLLKADLGLSPFEINLKDSLVPENPFSFFEIFVLLLAILSICYSGFLFVKEVSIQKNALLKRVSFLNQVVHELKTPLAGLKIHLQLIQAGAVTPENLSALNVSVDRLNRLFDDVVIMNRPMEKLKPSTLEPEELAEIFRDLKDEFQNVQVLDDNFVAVKAEKKRLRIILRNLVKNAIRYGRKADLSLKLTIDKMVIVVKDEGQGVPAAESQKIFAEFYRAKYAQLLNSEGLGLGLYLVRKLAAEIDAEVQLANPGEPGAEFHLILWRSTNGTKE